MALLQQKSIKKNLGYQTLYQILLTCLPLITSPYLSRVLGATQLGIYSFTTSIMLYFSLFAMLGTSNHGTRCIAACGDNMVKRSVTFWNIFTMQVVTASICAIAYVLYVFFWVKDNQLIALIQTIHIISCVLNINWLFFGIENFKFTVLRNGIIRILTVIFILILVKKPADLWLYALIMVLGELFSQMIMWVYVPKIVSRAKVSFSKLVSNFKSSVLLFMPLLAMSVYHVMDKTMLGWLSTYTQSGYYYNADKVVNVTVGVISGISTVLLPRMSYLISQGKHKESDNLFRYSLEGTALVGIAMAFGIAAIANEFEPIFFGPGYEDCILLTIVLAPVLIIKSFSFTARYQYLIPHHMEKSYTFSVILGAVVNLFFNLVLIPRLGAMGAVIGTLFAELTACVWQFFSIRKLISLRLTLLRCFIYFAFGVLMFIAVRITARLEVGVLLKIIIEVLIGSLIYLICCESYWKITNNNIGRLLLGAVLKRKNSKV